MSFPVGSMSLHAVLDRVDGLRRAMFGGVRTDGRQNRRLDALEHRVLLLETALSAVLDLLRTHAGVDLAAVDAAIERSVAAAEREAAARQQAESAADQQREARARARKRQRRQRERRTGGA